MTVVEMRVSSEVKSIISKYEGEPSGLKRNLVSLLSHGSLGGTGRLLILPVDQGYEHGPGRSFALSSEMYDPHNIYRLAIGGGVNALAGPLGLLSAGVDSFIGEVPLILKLNSSNSWSVTKDQAITSGVEDALRLGCVGVGMTIYPGSEYFTEMVEECRELISEARSVGLFSVVWSYPRGGKLTKDDETSLDVTAYAAHMASLLGAHVIKVKPPTAHISQEEARSAYDGVDKESLRARISHIVDSCLGGRRLVVFSGGVKKGREDVLSEIGEIAQGGSSGSIVGRNAFQRGLGEGIELLKSISEVYRQVSSR